MNFSLLLREKIGNYNQKIIFSVIENHNEEINDIKRQIMLLNRKCDQKKSRIIMLKEKAIQHLDFVEFIKPHNMKYVINVLFLKVPPFSILRKFFICVREGECTAVLSQHEGRLYSNLTYIEKKYSDVIYRVEDDKEIIIGCSSYRVIMYYLKSDISKKILTNKSLLKYGWSPGFAGLFKLINLSQQEAIDLYYS